MAMPSGPSSSPSPEPSVPHLAMKFPEESNSCIRLSETSETKTFPDESVAIPPMSVNWPSPEPGLPHLARKAPEGENFSIRPLPRSAT